MDPTPSPTQPDRREGLIARADEELAHARELITSADEQIARLNQQLLKLNRDAATTVRQHRLSRALRGLAGILLAVLICLGALAWRSPYGDAARSGLARLARHLASAWSPAPREPARARSEASHEMYLELTRQVDSLVGQPLSFAGKVMQSDQSAEGYLLRINVTPYTDNSWQDAIYVDYKAPALKVGERIVAGDLVSVRGTFAGIRSYQSLVGEESYAPSVIACVIEPGLGNIAACPGETEAAPGNSAN